ncbi:MAG TPA: universal stress protein [Candidatus Tectomicrobia bacterium]|nr:universal stress protein [Candidatus Tectomicrobia bacterium]
MELQDEFRMTAQTDFGLQPENIAMEIRRILAPTDLSELSSQGLRSALELAQTFGAKLLLLHIVEPPPYPIEGLVPSQLGANLVDDLERQASHELAQMLPETRGSGVDVERRVVVGIPYRKIVEVADEDKADLIVMTTHGRTGLSHLVMGSVAEKIVRTAPCPVLTIRPTAPTT